MALNLEIARNIEPFKIGDAKFILPLEWVLAAEDAGRLITTRMRLRSLPLAVIGPNKNDLACAPLLSSWVPIRSDYGSLAHLVGEVDNHPASIGPMIRASPLCGLDPDLRWTRTVSR